MGQIHLRPVFIVNFGVGSALYSIATAVDTRSSDNIHEEYRSKSKDHQHFWAIVQQCLDPITKQEECTKINLTTKSLTGIKLIHHQLREKFLDTK